ncbi:MAG: hypothetical protein HZB61_09910 [Nitrospirae bacterium]|nr:hypothetical protein [Nitrospirota bacterium]
MKKLVKSVIFLLFLTLFIFIIIEGLSSVIIFTIDIFTPQQLREALHIRYDELLGWVNKPNVYIKDLYGPGIYFRTNSQSFRNNNDFTLKVPSGKTRIICSGDSHTLGVDVDNDSTWCQLLTSIDDRLETINMGEGGYGVDQAYLWYMRDGRKFDHDIHVFAFIDDDFRRAKKQTFWGYQKPVFKLQNDALVLENVPVPHYDTYTPKLTIATQAMRRFKVFNLLKKIQKDTGVKILPKEDDEQIRKIALKIFESLRQANIERGSTLVAVYIPTPDDYTKEIPWRKFLSDELAKKGIIFIDLTDEVKKQPMHLMFDGHYSVYGNKYLANALYEKLLAFPEIKNKLSKTR